MTDLLCDNQDVMSSLIRALCDPGTITPRAPLESLESWQRRAVIEFAAPYIGHAAALAERERMLADPVTAHVREFLASDDLTELVRAEPPCSRDDATSAIGGLVGVLRMLLKLIEGERT